MSSPKPNRTKSPFPTRRLDLSPMPEQGYPRTPEHEQLEEDLHHDGSVAAPDSGEIDDDDVPTLRDPSKQF